jgi:hypothetical protein
MTVEHFWDKWVLRRSASQALTFSSKCVWRPDHFQKDIPGPRNISQKCETFAGKCVGKKKFFQQDDVTYKQHRSRRPRLMLQQNGFPMMDFGTTDRYALDRTHLRVHVLLDTYYVFLSTRTLPRSCCWVQERFREYRNVSWKTVMSPGSPWLTLLVPCRHHGGFPENGHCITLELESGGEPRARADCLVQSNSCALKQGAELCKVL